MKKFRYVIFSIFLIVFFIALNSYVMAQLTEEQLEAFRSAKTVRIVVEQSYGKVGGVSLPFEEVAKRFLGKYAGLKVVVTEGEHYDLKLKIEASGWARGAEYEQDRLIKTGKTQYLYTGASLRGSISLEIPGIPSYKKSFGEDRLPEKRFKA